MTSTVRAFMDGLIDYAGLFPPARLTMPDAVRTYARHLESDFDWMLSSFVCPVVDLEELANQWSRRLDQVSSDDQSGRLTRRPPIPASVLGTAPSGRRDAIEVAEIDAREIVDSTEDGVIHPIQFEVGWPLDLVDPDEISRYGRHLTTVVRSLEYIFFEIPREVSWDADVARMTEALREANGPYGFKIRTGGLTVDAYPEPSQVAAVIDSCSAAGIPFKATAGLHHPVRHYQSEAGAIQHGFVNVFGAAALAYTNDFERDELVAILEERDLSRFTFADDLFGWGPHSIDLPDLQSARSALAFSFGSCSFSEPIEDLTAAGLL